MARERLRVGIRATQFAAGLDEGLSRGAWERKRKDKRPEPEPEPSFSGSPHPSYHPNPYGYSQPTMPQPNYGATDAQYHAQQQGYNPYGHNAPNHPGAYGGQAQNNGEYGGQAQDNGGYGGQAQANGGYVGQAQNNGGYNASYSGPPPPQVGQSAYGNNQSRQSQNYATGLSYDQASQDNHPNRYAALQGQPPFSPPPLFRASTTGSNMSAAPPAPAPPYCPRHGNITEWPCRLCQGFGY